MVFYYEFYDSIVSGLTKMHPVYVNGKKNGIITADNRGLTYGDGFFETIRVSGGKPVLEAYHWARMEKASSILGFDMNIAEVKGHAAVAMKDSKCVENVLKIIITRTGGSRGYNPEGSSWCSIIRILPLPEYPRKYREEGVDLFQCETILSFQPVLAGIKHLNRLEQVMASREWPSPRYAEGVMRDDQGNIIECTKSNIFLYGEGALITPELSRCGVSGVMRQWILSLTGLPCKTRVTTVTMDMLQCAKEVFICNSVFGVWPVATCGDMQWKPGPVTRYIQKEIQGLFHDAQEN